MCTKVPMWLIMKLIGLQKRVMRLFIGVKPRDHIDPVFTKLELIKLVDIGKYLVVVFVHRYHIWKNDR